MLVRSFVPRKRLGRRWVCGAETGALTMTGDFLSHKSSHNQGFHQIYWRGGGGGGGGQQVGRS